MLARLIVMWYSFLAYMLFHHIFHVELPRYICAFFICTCIKSTTIDCFAKSMKSSEHDVQYTCSKDPIGVSSCLLNLECTVIKIQVKHYSCFPVWTNDNCRYTLCQHQYSIHRCNVSWRSLKEWSNYLSVCSRDTFMCV